MTRETSEEPGSTAPDDGDSAATLSARLLEEEARREQETAAIVIELADDQMPGVGAGAMTLREGLRLGGISMVAVLGLAQFIEWVDRAGFNVLAPDIQKSLGVSDAVIAAIGGAFGILFLAGSIPLSSLADRRSRTRLAAVSLSVWSLVVFATAFVTNAFQLFVARLGSGLGQSYQLPVNSPLLIDTYPIEARARIFALNNIIQNCGHGLAPLLAGGVAAIAGGDEGWRWVFVVTAVLTIPIVLATFTLREPRRGRHEMQAVLGEEVAADTDELPISLSVAFERLQQDPDVPLLPDRDVGGRVRAVQRAAVPEPHLRAPLRPRWLRTRAGDVGDDHPWAPRGRARRAARDALFRRSPPAAPRLHRRAHRVVRGVRRRRCVHAEPRRVPGARGHRRRRWRRRRSRSCRASISSIIPYRLRSRGAAMIGLYIFLFGAFFGRS